MGPTLSLMVQITFTPHAKICSYGTRLSILINYYLKAPATGDVTVKVMQGSRVIAETKGPNAAGPSASGQQTPLAARLGDRSNEWVGGEA